MSKATEREQKKIALLSLGLSHEEVENVLESDEQIDKGEKLFELSAEGKQAEKKYKNCGVRTVKSPYGQKVQKEKKVDFLSSIFTTRPSLTSAFITAEVFC